LSFSFLAALTNWQAQPTGLWNLRVSAGFTGSNSFKTHPTAYNVDFSSQGVVSKEFSRRHKGSKPVVLGGSAGADQSNFVGIAVREVLDNWSKSG
jgi:hypothetical protein